MMCYPLVAVQWNDAWSSDADDGPEGPYPAIDFGLVISSTKKGMHLASSLGLVGGVFRRHIYIPKPYVVSVRTYDPKAIDVVPGKLLIGGKPYAR